MEAAQAIRIAAANQGGGAASVGAGLGAGLKIAQQMADALNPSAPSAASAPGPSTKFCMNCGKAIPKPAKYCPDCGGAQQQP